MSSEIRLQVYLSKSGVASRRAAVKIIQDGRVKVNGKAIHEPGFRVHPEDEVRIDGQGIHLETDSVYIVMNKPVKVICTAHDPEHRISVFDMVGPSFPQRLFTVGRLDYMTSGLLLLTNDGQFAHALSHPRSGVVKRYRVEAKQMIPRTMLEDWKQGVRVRGVLYRLESYQFESQRVVTLNLFEGKNREIRNVFAHGKIDIRSLQRIQYGNLNLGNLKEGRFRELSKHEVQQLRIASSKNNNSSRIRRKDSKN